ncbi:site-specific integrase [Nitrincola iocasae]|uniref:Site-specific integrase n=2 Tax=Nitrincola iocasae TaxID=2614693 RepID=A0A5J6LGT4_9GAMM|nr:site-specific integrase [Nitrincola iocasae]
MPAHIPHTYRKPSGVYYFRYVFPKSFLEQFPAIGADLRFSLKTRTHAQAKLRVYQYVNIVNKSIDLFVRCYYNTQLCRFHIFKKDILNRYNINLNNITIFSGDAPCNRQVVTKKDFYTMMELIRHTHSDGSITAFNFGSPERDVEALALLKTKERYFAHKLIQQDDISCSFPVSDFIPQSPTWYFSPVTELDTYSPDPVPDVPDEVWDHLIGSKLEPESEPDTSLSADEAHVEPVSISPEQPNESTPIPEAMCQEETITIEALTARFFADNVAQGVYIEGDATYRKYRGYMKNVVEAVGSDTLVHTLTPRRIMEIRNVILRFPKRRNDGGRQHRTLEDLLADPTVVRIKKDMASEYFDRFKAVLDHGCILGYLTSNPADKVKIRKVKGRTGTGIEEDDSRHPFSDEDLINILKGYIYHGDYDVAPRKLYDAHFWVPLIAMYTGMRVGEICQLQISDIHTEGKRWHGRVFDQPYIQVCAEHETQRVKNENATRKVPIHPRLIEIGFLDYVAFRKHEARRFEDQRLFRHMRYESSSKWGRVISRWFNGDGEKAGGGYKHRVLDTKDQDGKVFHSFRHTVMDIFRSTLGSKGKHITSALLGHEEEGSSAAYGDGYQLDRLSEAMYTLRYSDEVEALVSSLRFDDYVQKMIKYGMEGYERNTRIRWPKQDAAA